MKKVKMPFFLTGRRKSSHSSPLNRKEWSAKGFNRLSPKSSGTFKFKGEQLIFIGNKKSTPKKIKPIEFDLTKRKQSVLLMHKIKGILKPRIGDEIQFHQLKKRCFVQVCGKKGSQFFEITDSEIIEGLKYLSVQ